MSTLVTRPIPVHLEKSAPRLNGAQISLMEAGFVQANGYILGV